MTYVEFTVNNKGIRYWFEYTNGKDLEYPHMVQVLIDDLHLIEATCTCTHGTINFKTAKTCTHIRNSINFLKEKELLK